MKAIPKSDEQRPPRLSREKFAQERTRMARRGIPELIDLLTSEDLRTRFVAEMCLRDATNT